MHCHTRFAHHAWYLFRCLILCMSRCHARSQPHASPPPISLASLRLSFSSFNAYGLKILQRIVDFFEFFATPPSRSKKAAGLKMASPLLKVAARFQPFSPHSFLDIIDNLAKMAVVIQRHALLEIDILFSIALIVSAQDSMSQGMQCYWCAFPRLISLILFISFSFRKMANIGHCNTVPHKNALAGISIYFHIHYRKAAKFIYWLPTRFREAFAVSMSSAAEPRRDFAEALVISLFDSY